MTRDRSTQMSKLSFSLLPALMLLIACGTGPESGRTTGGEQEDQTHPRALVGSWTKVFPPSEGIVLVLAADGSATGQGAYVGQIDGFGAIKAWQVGDPGMPGGLCLRGERLLSCQGFRLTGDTLLLANEERSIFYRSVHLPRSGDSAAQHAPPAHMEIHAPKPGEHVQGIDP
jgi:hypothetical protein